MKVRVSRKGYGILCGFKDGKYGFQGWDLECLRFQKEYPVAEFKEFERRFKFKPRLKYDCFHLKLYQMFKDLSRRLL